MTSAKYEKEAYRYVCFFFVVVQNGHLLMLQASVYQDTDRKYWGKIQALKPELNLIQLQIDSYNSFLTTGIADVIQEISPIDDFTGKNWTLELGEFAFDKPKYTPEVATEKGVTFDAPLRVKTTLTNRQTGQVYSQEVFLGDIPQ